MKYVSMFVGMLRTVATLDRALDQLKIGQGQLLAELNKRKASYDLKEYEFKVFSQWGDDGIIQKLISCIPIRNRTFIEFGAEDFHEANCRFLMSNNNWQGFVIDASRSKIARLRRSYFYWMYSLQAEHAFIDRVNVNHLLGLSGFDQDLGILSIDLDGVDYWILEVIEHFVPRILIVEYNAVFGSERRISVPYDPRFQRTKKHFSNLYFGASLPAFAYLAGRKGYSLVGTNSAGGNAYFVRNDLVGGSIPTLQVGEAYTMCHAREARDKVGRLTHVGGNARYELIKGLPVVNVETGRLEQL